MAAWVVRSHPKPLDFFPQDQHVEAVAVLSGSDSAPALGRRTCLAQASRICAVARSTSASVELRRDAG